MKMLSITETSHQSAVRHEWTSYPQDFPARIFQGLMLRRIARESSALEAAYGERWQGLQMKLSLAIWFLRTVRCCSGEDSNTSFEIFPRSGTMRNGTVGALRTSGTRITACGSTLLPTPVASDGGKTGRYYSRRALLLYLDRGHQHRLIYECYLAGLTDRDILTLYCTVMSFRISEGKFTPSETQLCLW